MKNTAIVFSIGLIAWLLLPLYIDSALNLFRLDSKDTVQDFIDSSDEQAVSWLMRMCNDGVCLDPIDWKCGFWLEESDELTTCFLDQVHTVIPRTNIGTVAKFCGKNQAYFYPRERKEQDCQFAGGRWGELSPSPTLHSSK